MVNLLGYKVIEINYKKNENFKGPIDLSGGKFKNLLTCRILKYNKEHKIQKVRADCIIGGEVDDPFVIYVSVEFKFSCPIELSRKEVRRIIEEEKVYFIILPYVKTLMLEHIYYTNYLHLVTYILENINIRVEDDNAGIVDLITKKLKN